MKSGNAIWQYLRILPDAVMNDEAIESVHHLAAICIVWDIRYLIVFW